MVKKLSTSNNITKSYDVLSTEFLIYGFFEETVTKY